MVKGGTNVEGRQLVMKSPLLFLMRISVRRLATVDVKN